MKNIRSFHEQNLILQCPLISFSKAIRPPMSTTYVHKLCIFILVHQKHNLKEYTYGGFVHQRVKSLFVSLQIEFKVRNNFVGIFCKKRLQKSLQQNSIKYIIEPAKPNFVHLIFQLKATFRFFNIPQ